MAEDSYSQYKEEHWDPFRDSDPAQPLKRPLKPRVRVRSRQSKSAKEEYPAFKATIASAVEELKLEIHEQHQRTRTEVQAVRQDVLAAVKATPATYLKVLCEFCALFFVFALVVRFAFGLELVNTAFALFMLPALAVYWGMASIKQKSDEREHRDQKV